MHKDESCAPYPCLMLLDRWQFWWGWITC